MLANRDARTATWRYADAFEFMERVRAGLPPAMICVACNGGLQGRESHPALPETADEIADSVHEAYRAGASMVHVHARNPNNLPQGATSTEVWVAVNSKIRERCPDIIINNTTGGDLQMTMAERLSCLAARPEVASLNLTPDMQRFRVKERKAPLPHPRAAIEYDSCLPFTYGQIEEFARLMRAHGVKPELETYHTGGAAVVQSLIERDFVEAPYLIQTVMGTQTASYPTPENVIHLLRELPENTVWLCSGIGPFQLPMTTFAILMGGHPRVGLEDNLYRRRGQRFENNAEAVMRTAGLINELNREVATPAQARRLLGLAAEPTRY